MNWYVTGLKRYFDFSGRSTRPEYWTFVLVNAVVFVGLRLADDALGTRMGLVDGHADFASRFGALSLLYLVGMLLPTLAVAARRLHDIGQSGWWLLVGLLPYAGGVALLVLAALPGAPGPNRYGPDSTAPVPARPAW